MNDTEAIQEMERFRRYFRYGLLYYRTDIRALGSFGLEYDPTHAHQSVLNAIQTDFDKATNKESQAGIAKRYLNQFEDGRQKAWILDDEQTQLLALSKCEDELKSSKADNAKLGADVESLRRKYIPK